MRDVVHALRGALDYTRRYRDRTFVVKVGGELLDRPDTLDNIAVQIALIESLSIRVVLVHGGGPQATRMSRQLGIEPEMVAGRRVTSPPVLEVAKMVYAGQMNVDLLAALRKHGVRAVGLSGIDGQLVTARRRPPVTVVDDAGVERTVDYGEVGDVESVDPALVESLLSTRYVPTVASLAADAQGRPLNINADTLAEALATALKAYKLVFLTTAAGLLRDAQNPASLVTFAEPDDLADLMAGGVISGGMRPKVEACMRAVQNGVRRTHIIDGRSPDSLLVELFTGAGCGTMIVGQREKAAYREQGL